MMKINGKIMLAVLMGVGSIASAGTSVTLGTFGFSKVTTPAGGFEMVGTAYDTGVDGIITLDEMLGTNGFTANWSELDADKVYVWEGSSYANAFLNNADWGVKNSHDEDISFKWCYMDGGEPRPCALNSIYDLVAGDSVYIKVNNEVTVTLSGDVPTAGSIDVSITNGYNMIMCPYPVDTLLEDIISTADGAYANWSELDADKIYVWDGSGYQSFFLNSADWGAKNSHDEDIAFKWCYMDGGEPRPSTNSVSACAGFYYYKETAGTMTWSKSRPYNLD